MRFEAILLACAAAKLDRRFMMHRVGGYKAHRPLPPAPKLPPPVVEESLVNSNYHGKVPRVASMKLDSGMFWADSTPFTDYHPNKNLTRQSKLCRAGDGLEPACYVKVDEGYYWLDPEPLSQTFECQDTPCLVFTDAEITIGWKASNPSGISLSTAAAFFNSSFGDPFTEIYSPPFSTHLTTPGRVTILFKPLVYFITLAPYSHATYRCPSERVYIPLRAKNRYLSGAFFLRNHSSTQL
ncbi:hypothetical protein DSO57_1035641 [Entomophthora muscae]|uniref:Uncharacterized protein n=1 Tax=Entomophthora muscae TaxID=34485 RepID=A0ACC2TLD8_9FUNG|nr:hypothetical protein DSO57_1035641 [Entomophthora muscae]